MRHTNAVCFLAAVATALCCGLATAAPLVGDVEFSGGDGLLRLSCPRIAISFDARSGDLRAIDQPATGARVLSNAGAQDVDWQVDDRFILSAPAEAPAPRELADYAAAAVDGAGQLTLRQRVGAWTLTQTYRLRPGQAWVERRVALQAAPGQKGTLKAIRFVLPGVAIAPEADCTYSMLSAFPPADVPFPESSMLTVTLPDGSSKQFPSSIPVRGVAEAIGPRLAKAAVAAEVDGKTVGLDFKLRDRGRHRPGPRGRLGRRYPPPGRCALAA